MRGNESATSRTMTSRCGASVAEVHTLSGAVGIERRITRHHDPVSDDEHWLLYTRLEPAEADIMMISSG